MSTEPASNDLFAPRGMNKRTAAEGRRDGWVGGRADTWHGHYREAPASRAGADARRLFTDESYRSDVAVKLRKIDEEIIHGDSETAKAGLTLEPLSPSIGTVIHGIDLANPTDEQIQQVWRQFLARKVVFFRDQGHITRDEHVALGKRFADIGLAFGRQQSLAGNNSPAEYPEILKLYADETNAFSAANWHSDVTWSNQPPLGSILLSRKSPPFGGDTMFVDCYALWDGLSPVLKEFFKGTHGHPWAGRSRRSSAPDLSNASGNGQAGTLHQPDVHKRDLWHEFRRFLKTLGDAVRQDVLDSGVLLPLPMAGRLSRHVGQPQCSTLCRR